MQDSLSRLVEIKQQRLHGAERLLRQARDRCEAAAGRLEQERRIADEADERRREQRQSVFEAGRGGTGYGALLGVIARSYALHDEAESRAAALAEAREALAEQRAAVARAEAAVHAAVREREKASRQHEAWAAGLRVARAVRQEADLQEYAELRAGRRDHG